MQSDRQSPIYAQGFCEDCDMIPKDLAPLIANNIDWKAIARDMELGGDIFTIRHDGEVHVFTNN